MQTLVRTFLYLALIVWLGAEAFFPVVAAVAFMTLQPDTHTAGLIVGHLLRILHQIGFASGAILLILLALAPVWHIYKPRPVLAPMILVLGMILGTAYSQFIIIPAMDRDRSAAGGAINAMDPTNPITAHFNQLHHRSTYVEEAIMLFGLATVVLVARAETARSKD